MPSPINARELAKTFAKEHGLHAVRLFVRALLDLLCTAATFKYRSDPAKLRQIDDSFRKGLSACDELSIHVFDGFAPSSVGNEHAASVIPLHRSKKGASA